MDTSHLLELSDSSFRVQSLEQLVSMWSAFSKCSAHLKNGTRLENLSWRMWHQKQQKDHFVQPILSLSAGDACHEVPQKKQTQHDHVSGKNDWSIPSSLKTNRLLPTPPSSNNNKDNHSRTTTPSLTNSYQYHDDDLGDDDLDDIDDISDDDYYYDDDDDDEDFLYDDDDDDDDDVDDAGPTKHVIMHERRHDNLRTLQHFEKRLPRPLLQRPSLLSALFKTSPSSPSSSSTTSSSSSSNDPPTDHFLKKEWTESLRNNVLWEHVQQKTTLYTNRHSYYPPPPHSYRPPHRSHHKKNMLPSDQGWLESFHGW